MIKSKRGFGGMSVEKQRGIASLGGIAAHKKGTAHEFTSDEARKAVNNYWKAKRKSK